MIKKKVLVTGANGTLGSEIINQLKKRKINYVGLYSKKTNITNYNTLEKLFIKEKPNYIIHTANKVYGIGGNKNKEFEMLNENLIINSNLLKLSKIYKIKKIICIGSSAVYSDKYKKNIKEKKIFKFEPHKSEYYYGMSKRILYLQLKALVIKTKIKSTYIVLNNLYGKNDNFNIKSGHVVPSLIHKFYLAKKNNQPVNLWGNSQTKRCFLYTKDAARMIIKLLNIDIPIINISGSTEITIKKLADIIGDIYQHNYKINWQKKTMLGVSQRKLDLTLQKKFKLKEYYSLIDGLKETIIWFCNNYNSKNIRK